MVFILISLARTSSWAHSWLKKDWKIWCLLQVAVYSAKNWGFSSIGKRENWTLIRQLAVSSISLRQTGIELWGQIHTHVLLLMDTPWNIQSVLKLKSNTIRGKIWHTRNQRYAGKYLTIDPLGEKALIFSVCWILWYICSHAGWHQATNMISQNTELERVANNWLLWASVSWLYHTTAGNNDEQQKQKSENFS